MALNTSPPAGADGADRGLARAAPRGNGEAGGLAPPAHRPGEREGRLLRPCLFIDKDGTLVHDVPYNVDPALLRFMPGAGAALARLQQAGLALVIVTNQAGIARGLFTHPQFERLAQALRQRLQQDFGVTLDGLEFCPHAPDADGRPACPCRKPAPGMLRRAAERHGLDLSRSWMVGDTLDDVEAGHRAGAGGLFFDSGGETLWQPGPGREPEARFHDWAALADHVLGALAARPAMQAA